jgi:hypothetical protein
MLEWEAELGCPDTLETFFTKNVSQNKNVSTFAPEL